MLRDILFYTFVLIGALVGVGGGIYFAFQSANRVINKKTYLEEGKVQRAPVRPKNHIEEPVESEVAYSGVLQSRVAERNEITSMAAIDSEYEDEDISTTLEEMRRESNEAYSYLADSYILPDLSADDPNETE